MVADEADLLRGSAAALVALLYRQPTHARLPDYAVRVRQLIEGSFEVNLRLAAGTILLNYWNWVGKPGQAREVMTLMGTLLDDPALTPLRRTWWLLRCAYHHYIAAEHEQALASLDVVVGLAAEHGIGVVDVIAGLYRSFIHLSCSDAAATAESLERLQTRIDPRRRLDTAIAHFLHAWLATLQGNDNEAEQRSEAAAALAERAGVPNIEGYFRLLAAQIAAGRGRHQDAAFLLSRAEACTEPSRYPLSPLRPGWCAPTWRMPPATRLSARRCPAPGLRHRRPRSLR